MSPIKSAALLLRGLTGLALAVLVNALARLAVASSMRHGPAAVSAALVDRRQT